MSIGGGEWRIWREGPPFAQRFTARFEDGRNTIKGRWAGRRRCELSYRLRPRLPQGLIEIGAADRLLTVVFDGLRVTEPEQAPSGGECRERESSQGADRDFLDRIRALTST